VRRAGGQGEECSVYYDRCRLIQERIFKAFAQMCHRGASPVYYARTS